MSEDLFLFLDLFLRSEHPGIGMRMAAERAALLLSESRTCQLTDDSSGIELVALDERQQSCNLA